MRKRMLNPMAAFTVVAMLAFGCSSSRTADNMNASTNDTMMNDTGSMAQTDNATMDTETSVAYNSQIEVGGDDVAYSDMFNEISNTQEHDILALAETSSNLSTFVRLVKSANLETALQGEGPFTLFAPTNEAFANLPAGKLEYLMKAENRGELIQVLQAHVLPAKVLAAQFNNSQRIATSDNKQIMVDVAANTNDVTIGGANIVRSNVEASNGVLHIVDGIITPTDVAPGGVR